MTPINWQLFPVGKLEFFEETPKEGKDALEGSKVSFVCRNTGNTPPYTVTWSVKNSTGQFILAHKGILTSYVDKERYKLTQENTALEITQLKLSDTGMYSCDLITLASGQHFFSAKVLLNVTGKWWVEPLPLLVLCLALSCINLFFLARAITCS